MSRSVSITDPSLDWNTITPQEIAAWIDSQCGPDGFYGCLATSSSTAVAIVGTKCHGFSHGDDDFRLISVNGIARFR